MILEQSIYTPHIAEEFLNLMTNCKPDADQIEAI